MGFFSKLRDGFRNIREGLAKIVTRKDVPKDVRQDIAKIDTKVEKLEKDVKPQERLETERREPRDRKEPGTRTYDVNLQLRGVSSTKQYQYYNERIDASSPEEAIIIAEEDWVERHGEIDYILGESARRIDEE